MVSKLKILRLLSIRNILRICVHPKVFQFGSVFGGIAWEVGYQLIINLSNRRVQCGSHDCGKNLLSAF